MTARHSSLLGLAALLFTVVSPSLVRAQDGTMTFGEEDAKEVEEQSEKNKKKQGDSGGEGMTFAGEGESEKQSSDKPLVGAVAVPSDAISSSQRQKIRGDLRATLERVDDIRLQSGTRVLEALKKRRVESCVREPLCLGQVGGDAGVDRIVLARVGQKKEGNYKLSIDYFNVGERLFIRYETADDIGSMDKVLASVEPLTERLFGLQQPTEEGPEYGTESNRKAMRIISYVAGGTAVATLGLGIFFGIKANAAEKELNAHQKNDQGVYEDGRFTQKQARSDLDAAQNKARLANGFFIASAGLAVVGGVLYWVQATSGSGEQQSSTASLRERIDVSPAVGRKSVGVRAGFSF